jgi:hypothetical protein
MATQVPNLSPQPLEEALVESFVKCVVDDKNDENAEFSGWGDRLGNLVLEDLQRSSGPKSTVRSLPGGD